jgi:hypothetical protein
VEEGVENALREQGRLISAAAVEQAHIKIDADVLLEEMVAWSHYAINAMDFLARSPASGPLQLGEARALAVYHANEMIKARRKTFEK